MTVPVVLLHALSLGPAMWAEQRTALLRRGHRVLVPELGGDGPWSLGRAAPSLDAVADELARLLDDVGIGELALVGSSMGGYLAMAFLRRHPGRVRVLGLLAAKADADDAETVAWRHAFARLVTDPTTRRATVDTTIPKLSGATTRARRPDVVARINTLVHATAPETIAWSQRVIAGRPDSFAVLCATDVPGVVIVGDEDELVGIAEARRTADALPRGELVVLPEAGHLPSIETPDAVTAALTGLLRRAEPTVRHAGAAR